MESPQDTTTASLDSATNNTALFVCKGYDEYIIHLLQSGSLLWRCALDDGTSVISDFDRYDIDPWTRLKNYCKFFNKKIKEVYIMMPGSAEYKIDDVGNNSIFIVRGVAKDLSREESMPEYFLTYGKLVGDTIKCTKVYWPNLKIEFEDREVTEANRGLLNE